MTNWCCLCNSDPCDCKARVQRKKDAALAVEQMCREDGERELTALRAEIERLMDILIACCNAAGGQAVKGVSVDFLAHVPAEITGRIERLAREYCE